MPAITKPLSKDIAVEMIRLNGNLRSVDQDKVKDIVESVRAVGLIHPLTLSSDYYLLSGRHRFEAIKALGRTSVECRVLPYKHDSPEAKLVEIDENLMRREITVLEQGEYLLERDQVLKVMGSRLSRGIKRSTDSAKPAVTAGLAKTTAEMAAEIGLSERTARVRMQIARRLTPVQRDRIRATPLADRANDLLEIAQINDAKCRAAVIKKVTGKHPPKTIKAAIRDYQIESGQITGELDIIKPSNWWAFGNPKYEQEDGFAGSIPGEVYANALYYFAPRRGVAIDGMAGSGMLRRVYDDRQRWQKDSNFDLEVHLFDKHPREPFASRYHICQHDMTRPLPVRADWLFLDPPYFGISSNLYQGDLSQTADYTKYRSTMEKILKAAWRSLNPKGVLCLYVTAFVDISDDRRPTVDVPADMRQLAINIGFAPKFRAYVSRGEQQRAWAGQVNLKAKRIRQMFSDACELLVFHRAKG